MLWTRLRVILAPAERRRLKWALKGAQNIIMPKFINWITIIISFEGVEILSTEKNDNRMKNISFTNAVRKRQKTLYWFLDFYWLLDIVPLFDSHFSLVYFSGLRASSCEPGWPDWPVSRDLRISLDLFKKISACSHERVVWLGFRDPGFSNEDLGNRTGNFSHVNTSARLLGWIFSTNISQISRLKLVPKMLAPFLVSVSGLKFLTQDKIRPGKRAPTTHRWLSWLSIGPSCGRSWVRLRPDHHSGS